LLCFLESVSLLFPSYVYSFPFKASRTHWWTSKLSRAVANHYIGPFSRLVLTTIPLKRESFTPWSWNRTRCTRMDRQKEPWGHLWDQLDL
jgi:hypothetical protein